jgi:Protein of unknown function (DUF2569)
MEVQVSFTAMLNSPNTYLLIALLVGVTLAILRRRDAIGGWLFYFFFALYAAIATLPFTIQASLRLLSPNNWSVQSGYHWYLATTLPLEILYLATLIAATRLLIVRTERGLKVLRLLIFLTLIAAVICGTVKVFHPPLEPLSLPNFTGALSALFWSLYFMASVRVKRVFVTRDWSEYPPVKS